MRRCAIYSRYSSDLQRDSSIEDQVRRCREYADVRYSSDLQRDSSIEDQVRRCREYAERQGWGIVEEFVVADRAMSGAAVAGRQMLQCLVSTAKSKPAPFDCVLVEDTSRLGRELADTLQTTKILNFHGVSVVSVTQGIDTSEDNSRSLLTLHGLMDEQYLSGLREKVHRGQEGRVLQGLHPGGCCYGYRNIPIEDKTRKGKYGRPAVSGVSLEIIPEAAVVIRRIFGMSAAGIGFETIAKRLNREDVPTPNGVWNKYTIRSMIYNERYRGVVVWNRTQKTMNPETGRKVSKPRPKEEWQRKDIPELRIVPEKLWKAVHSRLNGMKQADTAKMGGVCRSRKAYLFSGMLSCGKCRGSMVICSGGGKRGYVKYGCHEHRKSGTCENNWYIRQDRVEDQLLSAIEQRVFNRIDQVVQRCEEEVRRRLKEMERQGAITTLDSLRREQQQLQARAANLMRAIELGSDIPRLVQRFREVEDEIAQLDRAIASHRVVKPKVTAEQVRNRVVKTLMRLRDMLNEQEVAVARAALRKHVGRLTLTPTVKDGRRVFEVSGNFSPTGDQPDGAMRLVARDGFEPSTSSMPWKREGA